MRKINKTVKSIIFKTLKTTKIAGTAIMLSMLWGGSAYAHGEEPLPVPSDSTEVEQPAPTMEEIVEPTKSDDSKMVIAILAGGGVGAAVVGSILVFKKKK